MEEKKDQTPDQTNVNNVNTNNYGVNNSINNYGVNSGVMGHTINQGASNEQHTSPNNAQTGVWKAQVIRLVSESKTEEALAEILKINPSEDIRMQVALLAGRFSQLRIQHIAGILEKDLELKEQSSIRDGILTLISRL
jgi:hypothetical protein